MSSGAFEREVKVPCDDLEAVRERLVRAGARLSQARCDERNWIYDRESGGELELASAGCLLRLRRDRNGSRLTFKGPASYEAGVKVREEREIAVSDFEQTAALLEGLGYRVVRRYEKRRESWMLEGAEVSLDETPIGSFVEIEGGDLPRVAAELEIDLERSERDSYLQLYDRYCETHPEAGPDMVFAAGADDDALA